MELAWVQRYLFVLGLVLAAPVLTGGLGNCGPPPLPPACNDGADNDGDGLNDFPADPGCSVLNDNSERDPYLVCDDGIDNDGDGSIDYPADPECAAPASNSELIANECANFQPEPENRQPFFGDLHVHTSYSLDADLQGTRAGPDSAYDFARGATVGIQPYDANDNPLRTLTIDRPLDFAMVSDHAEFFGEISLCTTPGTAAYDSLSCGEYRDDPDQAFLRFNTGLGFFFRWADVCGANGQDCVDESVTLWNDIRDAAEDAYDRTSVCSFTSFVGYEWTGSPLGRNLHRNVLFRNAVVPTRAASYFEAPDPESLWDALDADCTGACEFLTIPHNSNLSAGTFFNQVDRNGNTYTKALAERRAEMEPLLEIIQHKGQSECSYGILNASSPNDELCDFEVLPYNNLGQASGFLTRIKDPLPQDFGREALKQGLQSRSLLGANPFKYGFVGGTDTHLATPGAVSEINYPGHGGAGSPARVSLPLGLPDRPAFNPGGLTVIWAAENSRAALFDAMRRREVYATSGTRPVVRFFGSRDFPAWGSSMCDSPTMIQDAYDEGVPMGTNLGPNGHPFDWLYPPRFLVSATKDPQGADLQRIQIVKLKANWFTGETEETVYEVAGDPENSASVDLNTCEPVGAGFSELCSVWTDPDFSPLDQALYYVRVIENPTCRWHKRQCNDGAVDCSDPSTITAGFEACCDGSVPETVQERAWTSPIWFDPSDPYEPDFSLSVNASIGLCAGGQAENLTVNVGQEHGFSDPVTLAVDQLPVGVTVGTFTTNPVNPPGQSIAPISAGASAPPVSNDQFRVSGNATSKTKSTYPQLTVSNAVPGAPSLVGPADGALDVTLSPIFEWTGGAQSDDYVIELGRDPSFATVDVAATIETDEFIAAAPLEPSTTYYWRVRAQNACGAGNWSAVFSFITAP